MALGLQLEGLSMAGFDRYATTREMAPRAPRTRRSGPRASVSWTVWTQVGSQRVRLHTADVSARGAKVRPRGGVPVGTALQLEFITPEGRRFRVSGVAWRVDADGVVVLFLGTIPSALAELGHRG